MSAVATAIVAGKTVPPLGYGLARLSIGSHVDERLLEELIGVAIDAGITYFDTARAYTTPHHDSHSEATLGRYLRRRADAVGLLIGTKGGHFRLGDEWHIDASPGALKRDCEASLRWLGVDRIDLYYLHYPDPRVPLLESVGALEQLRTQGLIGGIGLCNVSVDELEMIQGTCTISAVQHRFSAFDMSRMDVVEYCRASDIPFVAYSPLGGSRRTRQPADLSPTARKLAHAGGVSVETYLLAWVLATAGGVLALTGAGRPSTLESSLAALDVRLSDEQWNAIAAEAIQATVES